MKEWSDARTRVQEMKVVDPKRAEKMNTEITDRYQKEYFSLQTEGDSRSLQLDAVHQQHVQSNFNFKKRNVMQKLMDELQAQFYDVSNPRAESFIVFVADSYTPCELITELQHCTLYACVIMP